MYENNFILTLIQVRIIYDHQDSLFLHALHSAKLDSFEISYKQPGIGVVVTVSLAKGVWLSSI